MSEEVLIPIEDDNEQNGIVDQEAYLEYLELQKQIQEHPKKFFECSNGKQLNLTATVFILKRQMLGMKPPLPQMEQEQVITLANEIRILLAKSNVAKRKAHGTLEGAKGQTGGLGPAHIKQAEILDLMGRFFKDEEIHAKIVMDWKMDVALESVRKFRIANKDKVHELQESYKQNYSDVRLGHKRSRLDELSWLYNATKQKYIKNESRDDAKLLKDLLEQVRKEVEGTNVINGKMQIDINQTINVAVQQDMLKDFNITALIIAKMAGRLNVNPVLILSRLARSHYAKFTGFETATKDDMDNSEIYYPSGIALDFDKLLEHNALIVENEGKISELPKVDKEENLSLKERLLKRLEERQTEAKRTISI